MRRFLLLLAIALPCIAADSNDTMHRATLARTGEFSTTALTTAPTLDWEVNLPQTILGEPVLTSTHLFVATNSGTLYKYDLSGNLVWSRQISNRALMTPSVVEADNHLFVSCADCKLYAVHLGNGTVLWEYATNGSLLGTPVVDNGMVYVGSADKGLYALDTSTGTLQWSFTAGSSIISSVALDGGKLFFVAQDRSVYAVDVTTHNQVWKKTVNQLNSKATPAVLGTSVYVNAGQSLVALDVSDGSVVSGFNPTVGGVVRYSPTVAGGNVYVGVSTASGEVVRAFDATTGATEWSFTLGGPIQKSPTAAGTVLYVSDSQPNTLTQVIALDQASGVEQWSPYAGKIGFTCSPIPNQGKLYVVDGYQRLLCLN